MKDNCYKISSCLLTHACSRSKVELVFESGGKIMIISELLSHSVLSLPIGNIFAEYTFEYHKICTLTGIPDRKFNARAWLLIGCTGKPSALMIFHGTLQL
jgi:hypothetical protein